jgi:hypothetical protein
MHNETLIYIHLYDSYSDLIKEEEMCIESGKAKANPVLT